MSALAKGLQKRLSTSLDCRDHMRSLLAQLCRTGQYLLQRLQLLTNYFFWMLYITNLSEIH